jgi:hypothetical protein
MQTLLPRLLLLFLAVLSQPMHPLAEQAHVGISCFSQTGVQRSQR